MRDGVSVLRNPERSDDEMGSRCSEMLGDVSNAYFEVLFGHEIS